MNLTVKKIIENDFGECNASFDCDNCGVQRQCNNMKKSDWISFGKRAAVIEYIAKEILELGGFDYDTVDERGWNKKQIEILEYYGIWTFCGKITGKEIWRKCREIQNVLNKYENKPKPKNSKFYVFNPSGCAPRVQHDTYDLALEEAKRLVSRNVKDKFYVCEIVAEVTANVEIKVNDMRGENNG